MKSLYFLLALVFAVSSCSPFAFLSEDLTVKQKAFLKEAIICDGKQSDYKMLTDEDDIAGFFEDDDYGYFAVKYSYKKAKVSVEREVEIKKLVVNGQRMFSAEFKRVTFPGSDCRKIKSEWRHL